MHEEEMSKILVYLKGFTDDERLRLAQITALWLASGQIPAATLRVLINVSHFFSYQHERGFENSVTCASIYTINSLRSWQSGSPKFLRKPWPKDSLMQPDDQAAISEDFFAIFLVENLNFCAFKQDEIFLSENSFSWIPWKIDLMTWFNSKIDTKPKLMISPN